ncbi:MAG TPA: hypothetical protein DHU63_09900 [Candidatus Marinimicrobia bacterium]|nr:hypothetical protein [Candidatus Neomarinimicrobiota bacterium]
MVIFKKSRVGEIVLDTPINPLNFALNVDISPNPYFWRKIFMNRGLILTGFLAISLGFFGCGSNAPDANEELVKVKADLIRARETADSANQQAVDLKKQLDQYSTEMKGLRDTYDEDHKTMEDLYKLQAETKANYLSLKDNTTTKIDALEAKLGQSEQVTSFQAQLDSIRALIDSATAEQQIGALKNDLAQNIAHITMLKGKVDSLANLTKSADASPTDSLMGAFADFEMRAHDNLIQLTDDLKTIQQHIRTQDSATYDILSQLVLLENKILSLTNSFNEIMNMSPVQAQAPASSGGSQMYQSNYAQSPGTTRSQMTEEEYKNQYIDALSSYQNGNYNDAVRMFNALINSNRNNDLADNAQYWIAESFYSEDNYQRAIVEFQKVFDFSNSNKADAAQFKIGYCYLNMGNASMARSEFQKFLNVYPKSDLVQKATQILAKL